MRNENGKVTITLGMLLGIIILLLIIIGILLYKVNVDEKNLDTSEKNSYTELSKEIKDNNENKDYKEVEKSEFTNEEKSNSSQNVNSSDNNISKEEKKNDNKKELFFYSSGDNAAMHGNPELLYVYKINTKEIEFKYHAPWNEEDVNGIAYKTSDDIYVYTNGNYKIELKLNSLGENSIKVTEYEDDIEGAWKNLFTDEEVDKYFR